MSDPDDVTPEELAQSRRDALTAFAAVASGDPRDAAMASDLLRGADASGVALGALLLLLDALTEHGEDPAAWAAAKQDEAAALMDD